MDLRDYVRVLRKSWALILAVTVVGIALGVGLTLATTKVYQANTQLFVSSNSLPTNSALQGGAGFVAQRVDSYPPIATSPAVLNAVLDDDDVRAQLGKTGQKLTAAGLKKLVSADVPSGQAIVNLHVRNTNPTTAATLANALTDAFRVQVTTNFEQQIPQTTGDPKAAVKLTATEEATVPSAPIKPNKVLNIGLGFLLGLIVGVGVSVLREILDNTVKSGRDFEELGIPLLAQVAFDKRAIRAPIAFRADAHSARSEAYRQLRTNLQFVDVDNPPRIIAVTSAIPGEGKSTTAINLAAALAEAGSRVCLIEADLRRPSIAKALGLVSDVGFTTAVIGKSPVETVLQNAGKNLAVLTCGPIPPNPSELLISQHAKQVIYDIADKVDYTIIDTPPLLPVTDGAEIATIADATLLVHRAARTTRDQAARSLEALAKVGRKPVGVILNMVTRGGGGRYDYEYGYYYAAYRPNTSDAIVNPTTPDVDAATDEVLSVGTNGTARSRARHRDGAEPSVAFTPVDDAPEAEPGDGRPAGSVPVDGTRNGYADSAYSPVEDAEDTEDLGAPYGAVDGESYDDFYDEDATQAFAPVPGDRDGEIEGEVVSSTDEHGEHRNGRSATTRPGRLGGRRFQR